MKTVAAWKTRRMPWGCTTSAQPSGKQQETQQQRVPLLLQAPITPPVQHLEACNGRILRGPATQSRSFFLDSNRWLLRYCTKPAAGDWCIWQDRLQQSCARGSLETGNYQHFARFSPVSGGAVVERGMLTRVFSALTSVDRKGRIACNELCYPNYFATLQV